MQAGTHAGAIWTSRGEVAGWRRMRVTRASEARASGRAFRGYGPRASPPTGPSTGPPTQAPTTSHIGSPANTPREPQREGRRAREAPVV